jgi:lactate 2-monooxygenase
MTIGQEQVQKKSRENYGGFGNLRQEAIYLAGRKGDKPSLPINYSDLVKSATSAISKEAFDYIQGGAGTENTIVENERAFSGWRLVPRMLTSVRDRDTRVQLFGKTMAAPLLLAPIGAMSLVCEGAELKAARACEALGIPIVLSTVSSHSIEEVARAAPYATKWFQLYLGKDPEVNTSLVLRAASAGYSAIMVTPDTRMLAWRARDMQNAFLPFLHGVGIANYTTDPAFKAKLRGSERPEEVAEIAISGAFDPAFNWEHIAVLKELTKLPIVIKGILDPRDARKALDLRVDGIVVSNHGGRQIDGSISSLDALPAVASEVDGQIPLLFDSGVRTGSDIIKALALGAGAVLIGRPYVWGLALAGEQGAIEVVENILADFDLTLGLLGCNSVGELNQDFLKRSG